MFGVQLSDAIGCLMFSSQMLFSISQKLIQHLIYNYTEILKWLREILICHNNFLQKHKEYANVGSNIAICRQAHIKLEARRRRPSFIVKKQLTKLDWDIATADWDLASTDWDIATAD